MTLADEDANSKVVDVFVEEHFDVSFLTAEILTTVTVITLAKTPNPRVHCS